jgi:large exoprotein involved in heme utilization and adhesion
VDVSGGSQVVAGIGQGLGTVDSQAGDIDLNTTGEIKVFDSGSVIGNLVSQDSTGNGGNINIDADSIQLLNNAGLQTSTFGRGNVGNVTVNAKNTASLARNAVIFSNVEAGGVGQGGNININSASLSLLDVAQIQAITRRASNTQPPGIGDAGNVNIKVSGEIDIAGRGNAFPSVIASSMETGTEGNGGNITIDAGSLKLRDGAQLIASTF